MIPFSTPSGGRGMIFDIDKSKIKTYNIGNKKYFIGFETFKVGNMLEVLFGSKNRERVLQYILARGEGYAKEIATFYGSSLDPVQKQLERLEDGGILVSKTVGRTRLFMFNPRYAFKDELIVLLEKARSFYSPQEQERLIMVRKRPRRTGKPI
jgi:predicted transcriptional regulator